jgi:chemotaxis protein CheD
MVYLSGFDTESMRLLGRQTDRFLQPGEYFVGDASHRVCTLLGSCVSVTLWNPERRIGAMSHFVLATRAGTLHDTHVELDARYGDEALQLMLRELERFEIAPAQCHAKVFGGGNMFPAQHMSCIAGVGRRNGEAAREMLHARGIHVVSESLFGVGHRQIVFDIEEGDVWSRQVRPCFSADDA